MNDKKTEAVENKEDKKTDTKLPKKKKEIGGAAVSYTHLTLPTRKLV